MQASFFMRISWPFHLSLLLAFVFIPTTLIAEPTWPTPSSSNPSSDCLADTPSHLAVVGSIIDGDTIKLKDGQRVRLIGFNTPELRRRGGQAPFAQEATDALSALTPPGTAIRLHPGKDSKDRNGRLLAHVVRTDGLRVADVLVSKGLAAAVAVAPNTRCMENLAKLEQSARDARLGLWQHSPHWQLSSINVNAGTHGFHLITGIVSEVKKIKRRHAIVLDNHFEIIVRSNQPDGLPLQSLVGRNIEARGWLSKKDQRAVLYLHHPLNVRVID